MLFLLDRDGVINKDPGYISDPNDWHPYPGSLEAIAILTQNNHQVAVISNQSGIGRGYFSEQQLAAVHEKMQFLVKQKGGHIDRIFYCPHAPDDQCHCRKPSPFLALEAMSYFNKNPQENWMIGDSLCDIEMGLNAQIQPVLVLTGNGEKTAKRISSTIARYHDLFSAVTSIIESIKI